MIFFNNSKKINQVNHKIFIIMRLTLIFSIIFAWNVSANVFSQVVHFDNTNQPATVKDVLKVIEKQTDYTFFYNDAFVDLNRPVSIRKAEMEVGELLNIIFADNNLTFREHENKFIVVTPKELFQGIVITGTVTDAYGEPLPGVSIMIKGSQQGTATDTNGAFSLQVPNENAILVFSYIGFDTQEIPVGNRRTINVTLVENILQIDEVVVIGYGTAKRRDLTGATGRVNASEIQNKPSNNVMDYLRGTVAGFNSNMTTSAKGGGSMEIRGTTSLSASSDPLIVVDGIIYIGDIADINPADIESIDILKDGSSSAVYGTRAAAGILAITTKRGVSEKPVIDFNSSWGVSQLTKRQEVCNPEEYMTMRQETMRSRQGFSRPLYYYRNPNDLPPGVNMDAWYDGQTGDPMTIWLQGRLNFGPTEIRNYQAGKTLDWFDEVFQTGLRQDYNIGIGGKTKMTNYYFSLGFLNNQGILVGDKYQNFRSRLNLSMDVTNWLQIGTYLQFSDRDQSTNPASYSNAVVVSPYGDKYEDDGKTLKWFPHDDNSASNPFNDFAAELMNKNTNLTANLFANIQLPFGIKYQLMFNNRYSFGKVYRFYSVDTWTGRPILTSDGDLLGGSASRNDDTRYSWQVDNIFSWNQTIAEIHRIDATFVINAEKMQYWSGTTSASQFSPSDALGFHNLAVGLSSSINTSNNDQYSTGNALLGRINYSLMDKYLLTASYRRDGFSAFGQSHPYAYFPAVGLAYRISEESFLKGANWLDNLKIRLTWGVNGNRDIGIYSALANVAAGKAIVGNSSVTRIYSNTLANSDLRWEKTTSYNAGIDFSIFKNVLSGSIEGYMMSTKDLLMTRALPAVTAYTSVMANLGEITNKGMEITLNSTNLKRENLLWTSYFIFSFNRNQVKHLYGNTQNVLDDKGNVIGQREADDTTNGWYIGQALDRIYGYEFLGIWQESERDEAAKYGLIPGDGKLRDVRTFEGRTEAIRADEDRVFQGYTKPLYRLGLKNDLTLLKNFNLSFYLRADLGHYVANNHLMHSASTFPERLNIYKIDYWTPENPINHATRLYSGINPSYNIYVKRSFMRLQDVTLSYTLPSKTLSTVHLQSARLFINMNNLLTVASSRLLWDPETGSPTPRIFSFGLSFTL